MSTIIIESSTWRDSQLSVASHYGSIRINGNEYYVDEASDCLVRRDWACVVRSVGVGRAKELIRQGYVRASSAMAVIRREKAEAKARKEENEMKQPKLF